MVKQGKERRRRHVYVTQNTSYFVFDRTCVAVRCRNTGSWLDEHTALAKRLEGGAHVFANGVVVPTLKPPQPGEPMYFTVPNAEDSDVQLVTSRLQDVARPGLDELDRYPGAF